MSGISPLGFYKVKIQMQGPHSQEVPRGVARELAPLPSLQQVPAMQIKIVDHFFGGIKLYSVKEEF